MWSHQVRLPFASQRPRSRSSRVPATKPTTARGKAVFGSIAPLCPVPCQSPLHGVVVMGQRFQAKRRQNKESMPSPERRGRETAGRWPSSRQDVTPSSAPYQGAR